MRLASPIDPLRAGLTRLALALAAVFALAALVTAALAPAPLHAREGAAPPTNLRATLYAEGPARPGDELMVAIHFEPVSREWHGYWSNPGDAGLGPRFNWRLPQGWRAGEPLFPVPQRLTIAGLMNHVYKGAHTLLVPIKVPGDFDAATPVTIGLDAQWLACTDQICVPEAAQLTLRLADAGEARAQGLAQEFALWRSKIAPALDSEGRFELDDNRVRLAIPLPRAVALGDPHVFIETRDLVDYAAPQKFWRKGDWVIAEIARRGEAQPETVRGIFSFAPGEGVRFVARAGPVPEGGVAIASGKASGVSLWMLIGGAFVGGLLLNIMPCVFPILSLKALSLARAGESEAQARREGLAYTAGVLLATLALGGAVLALRAAGEQVGWAFQLQNPLVVAGLMLLALAITANLAGLYHLPALSITRAGEPASAFATGLLAAFIATPCTGPFMAAALGAALVLPVPMALALFGALGLGLAFPFLLIGYVPWLRERLPRPGPWMEKFRRAMAVPMGLTALALIWLVMRLGGAVFMGLAVLVGLGLLAALWAAGRRQARGLGGGRAFALVFAPFAIFGLVALPASVAPAQRSASASILKPQVFSEAALERARAAGRPVFLWFTADWCVTCKVNEQAAIEREATRKAFEEAGVVAMVGDWTRPDPEITAFLSRHGAAGVPLYLWYAPGKEAEVLPQVISADMLVERAKAGGRKTRR